MPPSTSNTHIYNPDNYRPCVGIMLINQAGQVFAGKRFDSVVEAWQMPQGGIDKGEEPAPAALRELMEEVGTDKVEIIGQTHDWLYYDLPQHLATTLWRGRYLGQRQLWFAMRFLGDDGDINIATAEPEFCEWKWVDMQALPDMIVPFKRDLYQQVITAFKGLTA